MINISNISICYMAYLPGPKNIGGELSRFSGRFKIISFWQQVCYILLEGIKVLDCFPTPCTGKSEVVNYVNWIIEDIVFSPKLEDPKLSERLSTTAVDIRFNMLLLRKLVILRIIQYNHYNPISRSPTLIKIGCTKLGSCRLTMFQHVPTSFEDGWLPLKSQLPQLCGEQRFRFLR